MKNDDIFKAASGFGGGMGMLGDTCGALIGAGMGFLWFNAPPAMVFMGDTGSLSMGAALGTRTRNQGPS